jgi:16S rRNA (guanine1516-N2)-methyltransferase
MKTPELICDFVGGAVGHRRRFGGGKQQDLPKALGFRGRIVPNIVDATAGLGRDAFLLATLGANVTLIERSAEVHSLLRGGMRRAAATSDELAEIIARMTLIHGDARELIPDLTPETILIDPMHPPRSKSALVKNEMRLLRELVGSDPDCADLLQVALDAATKRVVLKWPRRGDPIPGFPPPSHQIVGKSTRYDVFMR